MAKTTEKSNAAKAQKGTADPKTSKLKSGKAQPAVKTAKAAKAPVTPSKAAAPSKPTAKPAASKKAAVEKAVAKKTVAKTAAVKAAPDKSAAAPKEATSTSSRAAGPKQTAKKGSAKVATKKAAAAPAQKTAPRTSNLLKGRRASAVASSASKNQAKDQSTVMNDNATNNDNGVTKEDGRYALPSNVNIDLPKGYRPSSDDEYMGPKQLAYFRAKLRTWRDQLVEESRQTMENLRGEVRDVGDEAERATRETENSLELRTRDRYRKLISKIDKALRRIEEGRYGFCEETDEDIGVDRLDARPIATLSLDAQERREHLQKQMGD